MPNHRMHLVLIGSCSEDEQELHSIREVAEFIMKHGKNCDVTITEEDGTPFLDTFGIYINRIADMDYREKLLEVLVPMQRNIERYAFEGFEDIDDGGDSGMTLGGM